MITTNTTASIIPDRNMFRVILSRLICASLMAIIFSLLSFLSAISFSNSNTLDKRVIFSRFSAALTESFTSE